MRNTNTDWSKVHVDDKAGAPIAHDPETDLYDPNNPIATEAFWTVAKKSGPVDHLFQVNDPPSTS